jgi:hypothetical protein
VPHYAQNYVRVSASLLSVASVGAGSGAMLGAAAAAFIMSPHHYELITVDPLFVSTLYFVRSLMTKQMHPLDTRLDDGSGPALKELGCSGHSRLGGESNSFQQNLRTHGFDTGVFVLDVNKSMRTQFTYLPTGPLSRKF